MIYTIVREGRGWEKGLSEGTRLIEITRISRKPQIRFSTN